MNAGDLVHIVVEQDPSGVLIAVEDEGGSPAIFHVVSTDGQTAVLRWADDEVEISRPVTDLIPVNPLN